MRGAIITVAALIAPLFFTAAYAADAELFGISIGKKLPVTECAKDHSSNNINASRCFKLNDHRDPAVALYAIPIRQRPHYLSSYDSGNRLWMDGKGLVQSIDIDTLSRYHEAVLKTLIQKFGKATNTGKPYGFFGSVSADNMSEPVYSKYHWDLPNASLDYIPRSEGDSGLILMETPSGRQIRENFNPNPEELKL